MFGATGSRAARRPGLDFLSSDRGYYFVVLGRRWRCAWPPIVLLERVGSAGCCAAWPTRPWPCRRAGSPST